MRQHWTIIALIVATGAVGYSGCSDDASVSSDNGSGSQDIDEFWAVDASSATDMNAAAPADALAEDIDPACYEACRQKGATKLQCETACQRDAGGKGGGGKGGGGNCAGVADDGKGAITNAKRYDQSCVKGCLAKKLSEAECKCYCPAASKNGAVLCADEEDASKNPRDGKLYDQKCVQACVAKRVPIAKCKCYCPASGGSGGCYDTCVKLGASKDGCKEECGTADSGIKKSGAEACYNVCKGDGKDSAACKKQCYPPKTGK